MQGTLGVRRKSWGLPGGHGIQGSTLKNPAVQYMVMVICRGPLIQNFPADCHASLDPLLRGAEKVSDGAVLDNLAWDRLHLLRS